jgi:hypothetical protein
MKIEIDIAPVTPEAKQAIEDAWVAILRAELEARDRERRTPALTASPHALPAVSR